MQNGRADSDRIPDDVSAEAGRGQQETLHMLLGHLKRKIELPLILRDDDVNVLKWWVDASYSAHDDMLGHTGGTKSMGKMSEGR